MGMRESSETKPGRSDRRRSHRPSQAVTFNQMISPENRPLEAPDPYAPLKIRLCGIRYALPCGPATGSYSGIIAGFDEKSVDGCGSLLYIVARTCPTTFPTWEGPRGSPPIVRKSPRVGGVATG